LGASSKIDRIPRENRRSARQQVIQGAKRK
jgi:hypothetical protein